MSNQTTTEGAEKREEGTNLRLIVPSVAHKYVRIKAAEWDCSYAEAAARIITEAAERAGIAA